MPRALLLAIVFCGLAAPVARAQNEGQDDLDKATEKKIAAENIADLNEVIRLCEQALKKGLDKNNIEFANNLLTGTLVQRGGLLTSAILDKSPPIPRWPELRGLAVKDLERAIKIDSKLGEAHYLIARLHSLPGGRSRSRPQSHRRVHRAHQKRQAGPGQVAHAARQSHHCRGQSRNR